MSCRSFNYLSLTSKTNAGCLHPGCCWSRYEAGHQSISERQARLRVQVGGSIVDYNPAEVKQAWAQWLRGIRMLALQRVNAADAPSRMIVSLRSRL
jgi:hypothetical protein